MADVSETPVVRARDTQQITTRTDSREILAKSVAEAEGAAELPSQRYIDLARE